MARVIVSTGQGDATGESLCPVPELGPAETGCEVLEIVTDGPTLVLSGDFDVRSTWEVRNALRDRLIGAEQDVVVDLTQVTALDVTAARVLAYASREAARSGHHVTLRGCGPAVRRMLHLTRMMRFVEVEREAVTA